VSGMYLKKILNMCVGGLRIAVRRDGYTRETQFD